MSDYYIAALYKFVELADFADKIEPLHEHCVAAGIKGTLLLAEEGINGTIAGSEKGVRSVISYLQEDERLRDLSYKVSFASAEPFLKLKVKARQEIVTMGVSGVDPRQQVGTYIEPKDWNQLISDPEVVLIDTRNVYETMIGTFENAVDPNIRNFSDFPDWVARNPQMQKKPKVAMFCTGGIRCEKASSYLLAQGFPEVFHLKGGILKYLEEIDEEDSKWQGECFVFDRRVAVRHGVEEGTYDMCYACGFPLGDEEKASSHYIRGVSCPFCYDVFGDKQRARFRERQRQLDLKEQA